MDQSKTGKFIAAMRREKSMTQRQLADLIGISDKTVSKWETGKGMPEVSLMLPLCELLEISVNELLSGERLTSDDYQKKAEENIMNLVKEKEESRKKLMLSFIVCFITILAGVTLIMTAGMAAMAVWARILLIIIAVLVIGGGIAVAVVLDLETGTYECVHCGTRFVPTAKAYMASTHSITTRYLRCPSCGKKSHCKKRMTH